MRIRMREYTSNALGYGLVSTAEDIEYQRECPDEFAPIEDYEESQHHMRWCDQILELHELIERELLIQGDYRSGELDVPLHLLDTFKGELLNRLDIAEGADDNSPENKLEMAHIKFALRQLEPPAKPKPPVKIQPVGVIINGWQDNDGGRSAAGFRGDTTDCVTRSIAIATGKPYQQVYDLINVMGKSERITRCKKHKSSARTGVHRRIYQKYLESLGWEWVPTMKIGSGCKVHLKANELPMGRLIVRVSGHITTMIDGIINDTYDCSRNGTRCVYGYFRKKEQSG